jgi:hypothetical protein
VIHLQFRRFAGCPACNLHLRAFARYGGELAAAGVREVVVFHSKAVELLPYYHTQPPFAVVADQNIPGQMDNQKQEKRSRACKPFHKLVPTRRLQTRHARSMKKVRSDNEASTHQRD